VTLFPGRRPGHFCRAVEEEEEEEEEDGLLFATSGFEPRGPSLSVRSLLCSSNLPQGQHLSLISLQPRRWGASVRQSPIAISGKVSAAGLLVSARAIVRFGYVGRLAARLIPMGKANSSDMPRSLSSFPPPPSPSRATLSPALRKKGRDKNMGPDKSSGAEGRNCQAESRGFARL
jgi:hypothetical protein